MGVITISRQFGSGEIEFSNQLAQRLDYRLADKELIDRAAVELDTVAELVAMTA